MLLKFSTFVIASFDEEVVELPYLLAYLVLLFALGVQILFKCFVKFAHLSFSSLTRNWLN